MNLAPFGQYQLHPVANGPRFASQYLGTYMAIMRLAVFLEGSRQLSTSHAGLYLTASPDESAVPRYEDRGVSGHEFRDTFKG